MYIAAQIIGFVAMCILLGYTLLKVDRRTILICAIIINVLWVTYYLLLGAYTGAFCSFLTAIMIFSSYFKGINRFLSTWTVPIIFNFLFLPVEIITYDGLPTIIQIVGNFFLIASMWCDKEIEIKALSVPVGILWFAYNAMYGGYTGMICHALSVVFNLVYIVKFFIIKKRQDVKQQQNNI